MGRPEPEQSDPHVAQIKAVVPIEQNAGLEIADIGEQRPVFLGTAGEQIDQLLALRFQLGLRIQY